MEPNSAGAGPWIVAEPNPVPAGSWTTVSWSTGDGSDGQVWVSAGGAAEVLFAEEPEGSAPAPWIQAGIKYRFRLYAGKSRKRVLARVSVDAKRSAKNGVKRRRAPVPASVPRVDFPPPPLETPTPRDQSRLISHAIESSIDQLSVDPTTPIRTDREPFIRVHEETPPSADRPGRYSIQWSTADGSPGRVLVSANGSDEQTFAAAPAASHLVAWIEPDVHYRLRLVGGRDGATVLASTEYQRGRPFVRAEFGHRRRPYGRPKALANVVWSTGDGRRGRLYYADDSGREVLVAEGAEGTCTVDRIRAEVAIEFRLYVDHDGQRLLARTTVMHQRPFIRAEPNPVPKGEGYGTTVISWSTGDGSPGHIYLLAEGGEEISFAEGPQGAQTAAWIGPDVAYQFRLYAGREHEKPLASVTVTRGSERREIALDLAVLGALAASAILVPWGSYRMLRGAARRFNRRGR